VGVVESCRSSTLSGHGRGAPTRPYRAVVVRQEEEENMKKKIQCSRLVKHLSVV